MKKAVISDVCVLLIQVSVIMVPAEFQAVVFAAGRGSRFSEVCSQRPKCILPVGNLPMVHYPINMLHKAGFTGEIEIATVMDL